MYVCSLCYNSSSSCYNCSSSRNSSSSSSSSSSSDFKVHIPLKFMVCALPEKFPLQKFRQKVVRQGMLSHPLLGGSQGLGPGHEGKGVVLIIYFSLRPSLDLLPT